MENTHSYDPLLELMDRPAFLVRDGVVQAANHAARQRMVAIGDPIISYLDQDRQAYEAFTRGCLYLTLSIQQLPCGASVVALQDSHLFLVDEREDPRLSAFALAAQHLRLPMNTVFLAAETMDDRQKAGQITQSLCKMHRIICNMADASRYYEQKAFCGESTDLNQFFAEALEKATALVSETGVKLNYTALPHAVTGIADRQMLERAILNLISNAVKFSPKGSTVDIKLTRKEHTLSFTVRDAGEGVPADIQKTIFTRYLRRPGIEDSRHGLGLGFSVVRSAAINHGGTVLIDYPEEGGTRVTMTLDLRPRKNSVLRSPIQVPTVDYAGGHDHALLELSDVLPCSAYKE